MQASTNHGSQVEYFFLHFVTPQKRFFLLTYLAEKKKEERTHLKEKKIVNNFESEH